MTGRLGWSGDMTLTNFLLARSKFYVASVVPWWEAPRVIAGRCCCTCLDI